MLYSDKTLEHLITLKSPIIVEFNDGDVHIGYLTKSKTSPKHYNLLHLNQSGSLGFSKSHVSRIIYLYSWTIVNKDVDAFKVTKFVDIFELNDLVHKAGYELI